MVRIVAEADRDGVARTDSERAEMRGTESDLPVDLTIGQSAVTIEHGDDIGFRCRMTCNDLGEVHVRPKASCLVLAPLAGMSPHLTAP